MYAGVVPEDNVSKLFFNTVSVWNGLTFKIISGIQATSKFKLIMLIYFDKSFYIW